jgi:hypothetical protein
MTPSILLDTNSSEMSQLDKDNTLIDYLSRVLNNNPTSLDKQTIEQLIKHGARITPQGLETAICHNNYDTVDLLLEYYKDQIPADVVNKYCSSNNFISTKQQVETAHRIHNLFKHKHVQVDEHTIKHCYLEYKDPKDDVIIKHITKSVLSETPEVKGRYLRSFCKAKVDGSKIMEFIKETKPQVTRDTFQTCLNVRHPDVLNYIMNAVK